MPKERSVVSRIFSIAIFILLEVASLVMLSNNNRFQRLWFARISHGVMAKTWGTSQSIHGYFSLRKQNDELALENNRLQSLVRSYQLAAHESDPMFRPEMADNGFRYIPATIIKSSSNSQHNYLILDKASGAVLKEIPLQYKYNPGDTVYTSGYSAIFPPDIPIGIAGDARVINGATNEIKVKLFQDHSALKYVTIIQNTRAAEIAEIESRNEQ